ncbi:MAG: UPF0182 family protein [Candidatus Sungiibacteriota bacterium]|uniref:UPF0182 family protein n=1 Tax=Candidatus Sungiibacteriota bacterium TaxID=2750080 RepID=A0A7T5RJI0_9BACT|nr:MAG: UPF0182 family protein [Candidatus Sungbacteria bacterium]
MKRAALIFGILTLLALAVAGFNQIVHVYTEYLWFESFNATTAFWAELRWKVTLWLVGTAFTFLWIWFFSIFLTSRGNNTLPDSGKKVLRIRAWVGSVGVAILAAVGSWILLTPHWSKFFLFFYQVPYGLQDPIFGKEISFYLFSLPLWKEVMGLGYLLLAATTVLILVSWVLTRFIPSPEGVRHKFHLVALGIQIIEALLIFTLQTLLVKIPSLAYTRHTAADGHMLFYGAGALEAGLLQILYLVLIGVTVLAALLISRILIRNLARPVRALVMVGTVAVAWFILSPLVVNELLPKVFFKVVIGPNEITKQERFIAANIAMTREAFGLTNVETKEFIPEKNPLQVERVIAQNPILLKNIRLWDFRFLLPTLKQLQGLRQYYEFNDVDVDRYYLGPQKEYRHVMISAREIEPNQIPGRNWINEHLQYTHGYGAVIAPVNEVKEGGMPHFFVKDFPPKSEYPELKITRPQIYFGEQTKSWVLVRTKLPEIDFPEGSKNQYTTYEGKGGIQLSSFVRKLAFIWKMWSWDFLMTSYVTRETRIMYDRDITTIVQKIAPFLKYDKDPYAVVTGGKIYWMRDAMTTSSFFPHATPINGINYVRNSVKIVTDPYDGTTTFYIFDERDPLIRAWSKLYPGIFRPKSEMPKELQAHVRFSEDLFLMMAEAYKLYHMEQPSLFYNKEDAWVVAQELVDVDKPQAVVPYYIVEKFSAEKKEELVLMLPFTPKNKENLNGWLAARIEGEHYGKLIAYQFPKNEIVYGTMQIEARLNQDPKIAAQITLWNQQGSRGKHGNMLVIPVENVLLYVEPFFLVSSASPMPQLQRVSVVIGEKLDMAPTFEEALKTVLSK